jgi:hypothetical protein
MGGSQIKFHLGAEYFFILQMAVYIAQGVHLEIHPAAEVLQFGPSSYSS